MFHQLILPDKSYMAKQWIIIGFAIFILNWSTQRVINNEIIYNREEIISWI